MALEQRPTILAVDDTPINLSLLNEILKSHYRVKVANNGQKALEIAASAQPDLILLDVMMPGIDGFEVCRRLKADPATHHIPSFFSPQKLKSKMKKPLLKWVQRTLFISLSVRPSCCCG